MLVSGSRSPIGEKIFEQIIKRNPNVIAVLSGHYHSSNLKSTSLMITGTASRIARFIKCLPTIRAVLKEAKVI
ncbi:hypothetical protein PO124_11955 [Bacillus licheniformis]|nr:hypothetical protein [Bacillus licheniformis]